MRRKQIVQFIRKHNPSVRLIYYRDTTEDRAIAIMYNPQSPIIYLNTHELRKKYMTINNNRYLKAVLLHELGHCHIGIPPRLSRSKRELLAHRWAIQRAEKMKMFAIKRELIEILEEWQEYDWNGPNRIYRIAYKYHLTNTL